MPAACLYFTPIRITPVSPRRGTTPSTGPRAPLVLFQDDDDLAHPDMLAEHLKTHSIYGANNYAVLGHTDLDPTIAQDPLMHYVTNVVGYMFNYIELTDADIVDYRYFWTGRSSCKRDFLLDYGVFNPVLRFNEDVELGYRLNRYELTVIYNASAKSTMARALDFDSFCHRLYRWGRGNAIFYNMHQNPEIEQLCRVELAREAWPALNGLYGAILNSARALDRQARQRQSADLPQDSLLFALLYRAYGAAFTASIYKGIMEQQQELDQAA